MTEQRDEALRDYLASTATVRDDNEAAFLAGWTAAINNLSRVVAVFASNMEALETEIAKGPPGGPIGPARFEVQA